MGVAEGEKETFSIVDTATEIDGKTRKRVKRQRINERRIYTRSSSLEMQHVVNKIRKQRRQGENKEDGKKEQGRGLSDKRKMRQRNIICASELRD